MEFVNARCTDIETWAEASFLARLDYALHLGTEFEVGYVSGFFNDVDTGDFEGPWRVHLDHTADGDLMHRNDEYLDPYWDVTVLEPLDARSTWCHGPSYRVLEFARHRLEKVA